MRRPSHETCAQLAAAIDAYIEKADNDLAAMLKRAGYAKTQLTMREAAALEKRLATLMRKVDRSFVRVVQERGGMNLYPVLNALLNNEPDIAGYDAAEYTYGLYTAFASMFERMMLPLVQAYSAQIDDKAAVKAITKRTTSFVDTWSRDLAVKMKLDNGHALAEILQKGLDEGAGIEKITAAIGEKGIRESGWKSRRVALTETLRAHSYAQLESYRQSPGVSGKMWKHTGAKFSEPRENHVAMSGVVVPVDSPFTLTGRNGMLYYPECPRDTNLPPAESVNCHCLLQPVVDKSILGMSAEEQNALRDQAIAEDDGKWREELNARKRLEALEYRANKLREAGEEDLYEAPEIPQARAELDRIIRERERRSG